MKKPNKTPKWNRIRVNEGKTEFRTANGQTLKTDRPTDYMGIPGTKYVKMKFGGKAIKYNNQLFSEEEIWEIMSELFQEIVGDSPVDYNDVEQWLHEDLENLDEAFAVLDEAAYEKKCNAG